MANFAIAQFITLTVDPHSLRFQNYYMGRDYVYNDQTYLFSPFRIEGTRSSGADNSQISVLFPNSRTSLPLLQLLNGGRLVQARVDSLWMLDDTPEQTITEWYTGVGSTFDETTVEIRFRSAVDAVTSGFPRRQMNDALVGLLPQLNEIRLQ